LKKRNLIESAIRQDKTLDPKEGPLPFLFSCEPGPTDAGKKKERDYRFKHSKRGFGKGLHL